MNKHPRFYYIRFTGMIDSLKLELDDTWKANVVGRVANEFITIDGVMFSKKRPDFPGDMLPFVGRITAIQVNDGVHTKEFLGTRYMPGNAHIECLIIDESKIPADAELYDIEELQRRLVNPPFIDETNGRGTVYEQLAKDIGVDY